MQTKIKFFALLYLAWGIGLSSFAQGTAFTYQGRLDQNGAPYSGSAELQASLWNASSGGTALASNSPLQVVVSVTNGLFVLPLNFGSNFPGADRWLQLEVRTAIGPFTTLAPRQALTATPYAIQALNASTATTLAVPLADQLIPTNVARVNAMNVFSVPQAFAATTNVTYTLRTDASGLYLDQKKPGITNPMLTVDANSNDVWLGSGGRIFFRGNGSVGVDGALNLEAANLTGNFTANNATCVFFCNTASANITITLPNPSGLTGRIYIIKKTSASNTLTITASAGTIEGAASVALAANYSYRMLICNGQNWFIIGQ